MIRVRFFRDAADAEGVLVSGQAGDSLMRAAVDAGIDGIAADCGGTLSCATCHVMVREPWFSRLAAATEDENAMLEATACARQPNSRLCCQIRLDEQMDSMQVDLPASQYPL